MGNKYKILMIHNRYQQMGGEDVSTALEIDILRRNGHEVVFFEKDNTEIENYGVMEKIALIWQTSWSSKSNREIKNLLKAENPDIAHFQNTFPLVSPSAYFACRSLNVPVVQHVRNFRIRCASSNLLRDGKICELCWTGTSLHALRFGCYRDSKVATLPVVGMQLFHNYIGTWEKAVDAYVTPSVFVKNKLIELGFAPERIAVKPNFLPMEQSSIRELGDYAIVIGRLSPEKGILELLKTWVKIPEIPLKIIGDGPLRHAIQDFVAEHHLNNVEVCGFKPHEESMRLLCKARCLIMPSLWYETFGRGIVEAYANEVPVIVSRLGSMAELVDEGVTGFTFDANAFEEVPGLVLKLFNDLALNKVMGAKAKELSQQRYASSKNYQQLYSIYDSVIEQRKIRRG